MKQIVLPLAAAGLLAGCCNPHRESLADVYRSDFEIGTALGSRDVHHDYIYPMRKDSKELKIIAGEFDCVTPENLLKWEYVHPLPGFYNFEQADEFMDFAEANGLDVVGHVLVWHSQTPAWVFEDDDGNPVSREVLIERMRDHIHTVAGRYKGRIKYWDVVNEAVDVRSEADAGSPVNPDGSPNRVNAAFYRESPWLRIIGEDYIALAFRFAREADPDARLLYNDYSLIDKAKSEFVAKMVRDLKGRGVPIDGVGMQGHWHLDYPSREELQDAIGRFVSAGVSVDITELDVGILPRVKGHDGADISDLTEYRAELDPFTRGVPPDVEQKQIDKYRMIFDVLLANREHVDRVTLWGVSDRYSWKNDYPIPGRTDYPLLFDRKLNRKAVYRTLMELKGAPQR
jgi:endo-1,4-beta-xylanase